MTNFRFCRGENRTISFLIGESSRVLGEGGQFFILTQAVCFIFLMILIADFCLIIIIAPLDPFSLRFYLFFSQKNDYYKPKKTQRLGLFFFILALVVCLIFFLLLSKAHSMIWKIFFQQFSHPFFIFKVQMQNQKVGRRSLEIIVDW